MDIVVRRSYRSGYQRNAIRKALRSHFERLKARQPNYGRGRFRSDIFSALAEHRNAIRYPDGTPVHFGEDAVTDSDLRDALSPNADLNKPWETNDQKIRVYDAYLQIRDETYPALGDLSRRYEAAAEALQRHQGYPAESWQARGAAMIAADIEDYWTGAVEIDALGLPGSEDYVCGFDVMQDSRFDGKRAKMTVQTRYTRFRRGYVPNAILTFGPPVKGGYRPVCLFVFPLKGLFRHSLAVSDFKNHMAGIIVRNNQIVDIPLSAFFIEIWRRHEPIVLSGMAAPGFTDLQGRFLEFPHFMVDPDAYLRGERKASYNSASEPGSRFDPLNSIDQGVQVHLDCALFGLNVPFNKIVSMRLAGNAQRLVNNIFFDFFSGPSSMSVATNDDLSEPIGRCFAPPSFSPLDTFHRPEAVQLAHDIAAEFGLWMPVKPTPVR